jgi:hypothetical protein
MSVQQNDEQVVPVYPPQLGAAVDTLELLPRIKQMRAERRALKGSVVSQRYLRWRGAF